ncbi:MAG TPA: hypothetical protein VGX78_11000, partial [Pirellulales bacterium]|nr:hypothetical protein [Pirellulales bacterium]
FSFSRRLKSTSLLVGVFAAALCDPSRAARAERAAPEAAAPAAEEVAAQVIAPVGTPRQQAWLRASIDQRVRLAEQLGDEGARAFARAKGWKPIFDGTRRALAFGPDQAYEDAQGVVHLLEAKGGTSRLGNAYGYAQGTPEWAVESAKRVLRSTKATPTETATAEAILRGAATGKLEIHVIRTSHVLGEPTAAVLEQSLRSTNEAATIATTAIEDLATVASRASDDLARVVAGGAERQAPKIARTVIEDAAAVSARASDDVARAVAGGSDAVAGGSAALNTLGKAALIVGVTVDGGLRIKDGMETERQFAEGEISHEQREVAHAKNAAGMAGGWGGAFFGAKLGAAGGGAAGSCVAPGPGTAIGAVLGGAAGGVAGYLGAAVAGMPLPANELTGSRRTNFARFHGRGLEQ